MAKICFILLLLIQSVLSDECVRYTFGEEFEEIFNTEWTPCNNMAEWTLMAYNDTLIERPDERSEWFISPANLLSCVASFPFTMSNGGLINVNVFMEAAVAVDHLNVVALQISDSGQNPNVGAGALMPTAQNIVTGWNSITFRINIQRTEPFQGYITFMGTAFSDDAIIMVDSFRYLPPSMDEDSCMLYEDESTTVPLSTTTDPTSNFPSTSDPTTTDPSTTHPITTDPSTTDPTTTNPTTNDPTTTPPTTTNPTTTDPSTTDRTTIAPTTTDPTTTPPTTTDPTTTDPTTTPPTTTDQITTDPTTPRTTLEPPLSTILTTSPPLTPPSGLTTEFTTNYTPGPDSSSTVDDDSESDEDTVEPSEITPAPISPGLSSFWTPLTITMVVLLSVIALIIVASIFYYLGILSAKKQLADMDYKVPRILPRVTRAYPDINTNPFMREP